jgi:SAM-dependent methyltransferase
MQCPDCRHRWLFTSADQQVRIEANYHEDYAGFRKDEFFDRRIREELESRISKLITPTATLLDVGCGSGDFLQAAEEHGITGRGVDVSEAASAIARKRGLNAQCLDFLNSDVGTGYSIVSMWDVIEHLKDPFQFVRKAHDLLAEDGFLLFKIPSYGDLNFDLLRLSQNRSPILLGAPDHVQYFTQHSLSLLLGRAGFTQIVWFGTEAFRGARATNSLKKKIGRWIKSRVARIAGDANLYGFAFKMPLEGPLLSSLHPRDIDKFEG